MEAAAPQYLVVIGHMTLLVIGIIMGPSRFRAHRPKTALTVAGGVKIFEASLGG